MRRVAWGEATSDQRLAFTRYVSNASKDFGGDVWKSNVARYGVSSTYEDHCGAERQHKPHRGVVSVP
jgi:hypothetical protein